MASTELLPVGQKKPASTKQGDHGADPNHAIIHKRINDLISRSSYQRYHFEQQWFRAINYYAGNQWMIWDKRHRKYRRKKTPPHYPVPVTNIFAAKIDDNISSLLQQPPHIAWVPETDDPADIATAQVADRIDETIAEEANRERDAHVLAAWIVNCGSAFVESYYDNSEDHGMSFMGHLECLKCGTQAGPRTFGPQRKCPQCQSESIVEAHEHTAARCPTCESNFPPELAREPCPQCMMASAEAGEIQSEGPADIPPLEVVFGETPIGEDVPKGRICEKIRSPFEVFFDHFSIKDFVPQAGLHDVLIVELMDKKEAERTYAETEFVGQSETTVGTSLSMLYLETLSVLANTGSGEHSGAHGTTIRGGYSGRVKDWVLRETYYALPDKEFPNGLMVVRVNGANGKIVNEGDLPYRDTAGKPFIPLVHFRFKVQSGRVWGKTVATDLIPLQDDRNETEAQLQLVQRRMGSPNWILPKNIVDRAPTGIPGEAIWYKYLPSGTSGRPPLPQKIEATPPAPQLQLRLQELDQEMERLAGSFGVAHGEAPRGITAASALAFLGERQQRQVAPQISNWELGWEKVAWQQMMIFRDFAADPRVHQRMGEDKQWQIEKWSKADLTGRINAKVEAGSALPKSTAQQRAQIEGLVHMGAVDLTDPQQRVKVLEKFGEGDMVKQVQIDRLDAQKENDRFMQLVQGKPAGEPPVLRELFDTHAVHIVEHIQLAKTEEYRSMERRARKGDSEMQALLQLWEMHVRKHIEIVQAAAMAEAEEQDPEKPKQIGAGRPNGTGQTFNRGIRAPAEEESRAMMEPRALGGI